MLAGRHFAALLILGMLWQSVSARESVRVATLNLWHAATDLRQRTETTARLLDHLNPDVVGLQEVSGSIWRPNRARILADSLDWHQSYRPSDGVKLVFEEGLAVLSRAPFRHQGRRRLVHSKTWPFERRFVQWTELRLPSGQPFILMNTHLTHHDHESFQVERLEQALEIVELAARLALARDIPAVVVGDMNSAPSHMAMKALCGHLLGPSAPFRDVWPDAGGGSGVTYCPRNPYNPPRQRPTRIDYILILQGTTVQPRATRAWRFGDDPEDAVSDHYGIAADLCLENPASYPAAKLHAPVIKPLRTPSPRERADELLRRVREVRLTLSGIRRQLARHAAPSSPNHSRLQLLEVVQINLAPSPAAFHDLTSLFTDPLPPGFEAVLPTLALDR